MNNHANMTNIEPNSNVFPKKKKKNHYVESRNSLSWLKDEKLLVDCREHEGK